MQRTRTYECMCLLDNREVRKGWQSLKDSVAAMFTKHGAKILSCRRWEERRLAYAIRNQHRGTYLLIYMAIDTQNVAAIRRDLQFSEAVMRSLFIECAEVPQTAFEPEAAFDINAIPSDDTPAAPPVVEAPSADSVAETSAEATTEA